MHSTAAVEPTTAAAAAAEAAAYPAMKSTAIRGRAHSATDRHPAHSATHGHAADSPTNRHSADAAANGHSTYATTNRHRMNSATGNTSVHAAVNSTVKTTTDATMETIANTAVNSHSADVDAAMHISVASNVKPIVQMKPVMDVSAMGEIATMSIVSSIVPAREGIKERRRVPPAIINRVVRIRITVISTDISHSRGRLRRVIGTGVSVGWRLTYHRRLAGSCRWLIGGRGHCGRT